MSDQRDDEAGDGKGRILAADEAMRLLRPAVREQLEHLGLGVRIEVRRQGSGETEPSVRALLDAFSSATEETTALLRQAEIGRLAAGVVHECRNVMTGILGFVQVARVRVKQSAEQTATLLAMIEQESHRGVDLLRDYLDLARAEDRALESLDARDVIDGAVAVLAQRVSSSGARIVTEVDPNTPNLLARTAALRQVMVNLILNAAQSMATRDPPGGEVRITAHGNERRVELAVSDEGPGIEPTTMRRLFEPFFTTKPRGAGSGLGLYVSRSLIEGCGGTLTVESEPGHGATFRIHLPAATREEAGE